MRLFLPAPVQLPLLPLSCAPLVEFPSFSASSSLRVSSCAFSGSVHLLRSILSLSVLAQFPSPLSLCAPLAEFSSRVSLYFSQFCYRSISVLCNHLLTVFTIAYFFCAPTVLVAFLYFVILIVASMYANCC